VGRRLGTLGSLLLELGVAWGPRQGGQNDPSDPPDYDICYPGATTGDIVHQCEGP